MTHTTQTMLRNTAYLHEQIARGLAAQQLPGMFPTAITNRRCEAARPRPQQLATPQTRHRRADAQEVPTLALRKCQIAVCTHACRVCKYRVMYTRT